MQKLLRTVDTQEPRIYDMLKAVELKKQSSAAGNSLFRVKRNLPNAIFQVLKADAIRPFRKQSAGNREENRAAFSICVFFSR